MNSKIVGQQALQEPAAWNPEAAVSMTNEPSDRDIFNKPFIPPFPSRDLLYYQIITQPRCFSSAQQPQTSKLPANLVGETPIAGGLEAIVRFVDVVKCKRTPRPTFDAFPPLASFAPIFCHCGTDPTLDNVVGRISSLGMMYVCD